MKSDVTIIDYGMGNLFSVKRAFEHRGATTEVADAAEGIRAAQRLLLPGVGAFGDCMENLRCKGLIDPIRDAVAAGIPLLGICVGMQVLFEEGDEFGIHAGIGLLRGRVTRIPGSNGRKVPHVGWAELHPARDWTSTVFGALRIPAGAYFSHSYAAQAADPDDELAYVDYRGARISAAVQRGCITACQFHPERSGSTGLQVLDGFLGSTSPAST